MAALGSVIRVEAAVSWAAKKSGDIRDLAFHQAGPITNQPTFHQAGPAEVRTPARSDVAVVTRCGPYHRCRRRWRRRLGPCLCLRGKPPSWGPAADGQAAAGVWARPLPGSSSCV